MNYKLFLDDIRNPTESNWVVCREVKTAKNFIQQNGMPYLISFDHDLGEGENGYDLAKWLIEMDYTNEIRLPENFNFQIHSANPVGRDSINQVLQHYLNVHRIHIPTR